MPISISEFAQPSWVKQQERYPLSYNKEDRYNETCPRDTPNRYMGDVGREGGWKYPGYNPNHNSTRIEKFKIRTDGLSFKPY